MWNIAFDKLLEGGNFGPNKMVGFADDACLIVTVPDPSILVDLAQQAVDQTVRLCAESGLEFSAGKTAIVLFTLKRKKQQLPKLKVNGIEVDFSQSTRYLGVELDNKLNYNLHMKQKV